MAQEPARQQRRRPDHRRRRRRHQPQLADEVELRPRGRVRRPDARRPTTAPARRPSPRSRRCAALEQADHAEVPDRLPLVRPADPLPRGLAGRDAADRRAADGGARRRRRQPGGRRASTPTSRRELYTTNGDVTDDALRTLRHAGLHGRARRRHRPGGRRHRRRRPNSFTPGGFVFQDSEADVQAEFQKNLAVRARPGAIGQRPGRTRSRTSATPRPTSCRRRSRSSYGDPQTVEVNAKRVARRRARCTGGSTAAASTRRRRREYERRHALRRARASTTTACAAQVTGTQAGRQGQGVVHRPAASSRTPFTYTVAGRVRQQGAAHGRRGLHAARSPLGAAPLRRPAVPRLLHERAGGRGHRLRRLRRRRARPHRAVARSACSSHYKAVIWYTGDDLYVARRPGQPGGTGTAKLARRRDHRGRDYMNEGGKLLVDRQDRAPGRVGPVPLQPARADAAERRAARPTRRWATATPTTRRARTFNCVVVVQRLPAVLARARTCRSRGGDPDARLDAARAAGRSARRAFGAQRRRLGGQPGQPVLVPDDVEHPAAGPVPAVQRATQAIKSTARRPSTRRRARTYVYSQPADAAYKRLHAHGRPDRQDDAAR